MPPEIKRPNQPRFVSMRFAAAEGEEAEQGIVEGYASLFGVEFSTFFGTHRLEKGAFEASLDENPTIPVFWEHQWEAGPIGTTLEASEDDTGLRVKAQLFIDDNVTARGVFNSMKAGAIKEWSIGFMPTEVHYEKVSHDDGGDDGGEAEASARKAHAEGEEIEVITAGDLMECSPVVRGAVPGTSTERVASIFGTTDPLPISANTGGVNINIQTLDSGSNTISTPVEPPDDTDQETQAIELRVDMLNQPWYREMVREHKESLE